MAVASAFAVNSGTDGLGMDVNSEAYTVPKSVEPATAEKKSAVMKYALSFLTPKH